ASLARSSRSAIIEPVSTGRPPRQSLRGVTGTWVGKVIISGVLRVAMLVTASLRRRAPDDVVAIIGAPNDVVVVVGAPDDVVVDVLADDAVRGQMRAPDDVVAIAGRPDDVLLDDGVVGAPDDVVVKGAAADGDAVDTPDDVVVPRTAVVEEDAAAEDA